MQQMMLFMLDLLVSRLKIDARGFAKFGGVDYSQTLYESGTIVQQGLAATNALVVQGNDGGVKDYATIFGDGSANFMPWLSGFIQRRLRLLFCMTVKKVEVR